MRTVVQQALRSWRVKAELQRAIARLPPAIGDRAYHALQTVRGLAPNPKRNFEFVERVAAFAARAGKPLDADVVVELGSGWFPTTPLALLARGHAAHVHTFDLNRHYSRHRVKQAANAILASTHSEAVAQIARSGDLAPSVDYHAPVDIADAHLAPHSVDVAISEFVLEHVEESALARIHERSRAWMKPNGLWIHWISPGDHRAYSDTTLHPVDFLRYSRAEWMRIAGNRYAYHNRLRRPHYRALFEQAGWRVVAEDASISSRALSTLDQLPVHSDFRELAREDLVAGSLWFVLAQKDGT